MCVCVYMYQVLLCSRVHDLCNCMRYLYVLLILILLYTETVIVPNCDHCMQPVENKTARAYILFNVQQLN